MARVRFIEDYVVKDREGRQFKAGQIYDLSEDGARHFISRGRAVAVEDVVEEVVEEPAVVSTGTSATTPAATLAKGKAAVKK
ncbi:hypothetical protein [Megalodesulfovibrio gigas]|uniref:Uncharacterized protein n=1 Tax=Megalodesulfovibrio gigas (strain ATCC 19364 / DSM 1382 / NCIMB 9332 / VKM B-1759) TaxID=1121448 RepID=T2GB54_MEGG1|nr:hypothetical protein [Megalodesulfovibrio gigas]AGW13820.1 hypothetical protein DGI_2051 [Megalodesulfovibrio gigas DSM 1382 = ATCC 19364]